MRTIWCSRCSMAAAITCAAARHYYNGHRGIRDYRRGYRQHNGLWFRSALCAAGAIIAVPSIDGRRSIVAIVRSASAHDMGLVRKPLPVLPRLDNSFQPYNGPRQQCYSPYSR